MSNASNINFNINFLSVNSRVLFSSVDKINLYDNALNIYQEKNDNLYVI